MNPQEYKTSNYMVPSNGQTHAVLYSGNFAATPFNIDWRQYTLDNALFQPQGVFINNTAGTVPLVITILPINYVITCPAGQVMQAQFPAPNGQGATITGDPNNVVQVIFVDFPVLPSQTQATILGTVNAQITGVSGGVVMRVDPNPLAAGNTLPYRVQEYVEPVSYSSFTIAAGATTANVAGPANYNLRKLRVTVSGDAALAVAGQDVLTITLNGITIFTDTFYFPAAAAAGIARYELCNLDFDFVAPGVGAAGTLVATWGTALATGKTTVNAYFGAQ